MKIKLLLTIFALAIFSSCSNDDEDNRIARLEVNNQTGCLVNMYAGQDASAEFLGSVSANETEIFEINISSVFSGVYYSDAQNCGDIGGEQFFVTLNENETTTILVD